MQVNVEHGHSPLNRKAGWNTWSACESRLAAQAVGAHAGMSVRHVSEITGGVDVIDRLTPAWRQLCDENANSQPFFRPEFVRAYVRAFLPEKKLTVLVVTEGERVNAILPLIIDRSVLYGLPVRRIRGAANVHSCRFDLVRRPGQEGEDATAALWSFLKNRPGWDLMEFEAVPDGGALEALVKEASMDGFPTGVGMLERSPYVGLAERCVASEDWLQSLRPDFRQRIRRLGRKLAGEGELRLRRFESADPNLLTKFYDLERSGWKGKKGTAISCDPATRMFYDDVAESASKFGYLCCYFLEFNDQVIAGHFGLSDGSRYYMLKPAYDEKFNRFSPGHLLVHFVLQDCVTRNVNVFDFLPPWAEWKGKWASTSGSESTRYVFHRGRYGRLLASLKFSVIRRLKSIIPRTDLCSMTAAENPSNADKSWKSEPARSVD